MFLAEQPEAIAIIIKSEMYLFTSNVLWPHLFWPHLFLDLFEQVTQACYQHIKKVLRLHHSLALYFHLSLGTL